MALKITKQDMHGNVEVVYSLSEDEYMDLMEKIDEYADKLLKMELNMAAENTDCLDYTVLGDK